MDDRNTNNNNNNDNNNRPGGGSNRMLSVVFALLLAMMLFGVFNNYLNNRSSDLDITYDKFVEMVNREVVEGKEEVKKI